MKNIVLFAAFLLFSTMAFGQNSSDKKKSEQTMIKNLISGSFDEIWSGLATEKIEKFHTKDFVLLEHGEVWNNDTIANYLNAAKLRQPAAKRENSFEFIEIKIGKGTAWAAYHNYATFSVDGKVVRKAHWLESATAVKTKDGWKLDMLHSTRVPIKE